MGQTVLVTLEPLIRRPMLVTNVAAVNIAAPMQPIRLATRVSGTIFCEPDDHTRVALRTLGEGTHDPARIHGRPDRLLPLAYGEYLAYGEAPGCWVEVE